MKNQEKWTENAAIRLRLQLRSRVRKMVRANFVKCDALTLEAQGLFSYANCSIECRTNHLIKVLTVDWYISKIISMRKVHTNDINTTGAMKL